jgi:hypothetical protein
MDKQQLSEWAEAVAVTTLMRLKENRVKMRPEVEREIHYQLSLDVRLHLELVSEAADELRDERRKLAAILRIDEDSNILSQVETLRDFAELTSGSEGEQEEIRTLKAQRDALLAACEAVDAADRLYYRWLDISDTDSVAVLAAYDAHFQAREHARLLCRAAITKAKGETI